MAQVCVVAKAERREGLSQVSSSSMVFPCGLKSAFKSTQAPVHLVEAQTGPQITQPRGVAMQSLGASTFWDTLLGRRAPAMTQNILQVRALLAVVSGT